MTPEEIQQFVQNGRQRGKSDEELITGLLSQGVTAINAQTAVAKITAPTPQPLIQNPASSADIPNAPAVQASYQQVLDENFEADPGYMQSFSWGYFGTTIFYAFGMRLSPWFYVAPLVYNIFWFIIRIPLSFFFAFIPFFGPFLLLAANFIVPYGILYMLAHQVRLPARKSRAWKSDAEFAKAQDVWDYWGKIVFVAYLSIQIVLYFALFR